MTQSNIQVCCLIAVILHCAVVKTREIPTSSNIQSATSLRGGQSPSAAATNGFADIESDDDAPREAGSKRELGDVYYHHGGHGGGASHHHGHATSYQNYILHSYHPKKVIYHKKHGHHHHSPAPGSPVDPHHVALPVHAAPVPTYDETADDGSYPTY